MPKTLTPSTVERLKEERTNDILSRAIDIAKMEHLPVQTRRLALQIVTDAHSLTGMYRGIVSRKRALNSDLLGLMGIENLS